MAEKTGRTAKSRLLRPDQASAIESIEIAAVHRKSDFVTLLCLAQRALTVEQVCVSKRLRRTRNVPKGER